MKKLAGIADYNRIPAFSVSENAKVLLRYEYVERSLVRMMAGWMAGVKEWEAKLLLGRMVWEDAVHATDLRTRILELRTGSRALERCPDPHLELMLEEALLAEDSLAFLSGLIVIKQHLLAAYRKHLTQTQPLVDQPTTRLLSIIIMEVGHQLEELDNIIAIWIDDSNAGRLHQWQQTIEALIHAAAGIQGLEPVVYNVKSETLRTGKGAKFMISKTYGLDSRFELTQPYRYSPEQKPDPADPDALQRGMGLARFYEMQAALGIATSIYENDGMPWEYYSTLARHLWDEIRHCAMGQGLIESLGMDATKVPHWTGNYEFYTTLTPQERYIRLGVIIELEAMESGTKKAEYDFCRKNGFELAETFQDYDWADEVNHVEWARRWVQYMVDGDQELLERKVAEVKMKYAEFKKPWEEQGNIF